MKKNLNKEVEENDEKFVHLVERMSIYNQVLNIRTISWLLVS